MFFSNYGKAIESIDQTYLNRLSELKSATQEDITHLNNYISLLEEYEYFLNDRITDVFWERGELKVELVERKSIFYCEDPKRRNEGWSEWVNLGLDDGKYKKKLAELTSEIEAVKSTEGIEERFKKHYENVCRKEASKPYDLYDPTEIQTLQSAADFLGINLD